MVRNLELPIEFNYILLYGFQIFVQLWGIANSTKEYIYNVFFISGLFLSKFYQTIWAASAVAQGT